MDAIERAREAGDRRALFAELGIPMETPYRYVEAWSPAAGEARARYGVIQPDGERLVEHERRLRVLPGESWPPRYRLTCYGVEPVDAVLLGMGVVRQLARLPVGPTGGAILVSDPDGWESWGTAQGFLWLRVTARYGDSPLYAERRRRIDRTWEDGVRGLQFPHDRDDRVRAEAGLRHLRTWEESHERRRKQPGAGRPTAEEFTTKCEEVATDMWRRGIPVDDREVFLGYLGEPSNKTTLYAWLRDYRRRPEFAWLTWPNLRLRLRRNVLDEDGRTKRDTRRPLRE
jgi:hypothetical protein